MAAVASPIEDLLFGPLQETCSDHGWKLHRQVRLGPYVVDFLVEAALGIFVIVECDGHDFHDRTKEQAARDRSRDRFLLAAAGTSTVRFTGSEIWRDAELCAAEVEKIIDTLYQEKEQAVLGAR